MSVSWLTVWEVCLTVTLIISTSITIFIVTLPRRYEHSYPPRIEETDFSKKDTTDPDRSGYGYFQTHKNDSGELIISTSVQVLVLGDIGRSPRMQYHALSLAAHGAKVQLIGYVDSELHPDILASRFITIIAIPPHPKRLQTSSRLFFALIAPLKALFQTLTLYSTLAYRAKATRYMLVQNPPSIPVLAVAVFVCFFRNTRLIVDWHNYGFSILALRLGPAHPFVKISESYERFFGRRADAHFAVTDAMTRALSKRFGVPALTLHDRPAAHFTPLNPDQQKAFLRSCGDTKDLAAEIAGGRRRLVVSSTSWTADEDFGVLLEALTGYSDAVAEDRTLPTLLAIITGKGPQKNEYLSRIHQLENDKKLANVVVRTAWLSIADYASLLASADLGISLHTSSSGVDLPMKVVDMFGAGLPVAGWSKFDAWPELVHEGVNGCGFESAVGLQRILQDLFGDNGDELQKLRDGALKEGQRRWEDEWMPVAGRVFELDS